MCENETAVPRGSDDESASGVDQMGTTALRFSQVVGGGICYVPPGFMVPDSWTCNPVIFGFPHWCCVTITDPENSTAGESCVDEESGSQNDGELWLAERRRSMMNQN